jgi:hypothetical protein
MGQTALSTSLTEAALARLDHLMAEVRHSHDGQTDLLLEHLQSARTYLLGAMPDEYEFSLVTARQLASQVTEAALQNAITQEADVLLDQMRSAPPPPQPATPARRNEPKRAEEAGKSELYRFFHGSPTALGVFYPTHYVFASFPSLQNAKSAGKTLQAAGYSETVATSAAETYRFMNEVQADVGLWGALMASISRFFGTEEVFADIDLAKVNEGAAFLATYCPEEQQAERIRDLVLPFEPMAMQLYLPGGIQSLVAGNSPGPQGNHPEQN